MLPCNPLFLPSVHSQCRLSFTGSFTPRRSNSGEPLQAELFMCWVSSRTRSNFIDDYSYMMKTEEFLIGLFVWFGFERKLYGQRIPKETWAFFFVSFEQPNKNILEGFLLCVSCPNVCSLDIEMVPVCPMSDINLEEKFAWQTPATQMSRKSCMEWRWWQMGDDALLLIAETVTYQKDLSRGSWAQMCSLNFCVAPTCCI